MKHLSLPSFRKKQIAAWTAHYDTPASRLQMALTVGLTGAFGFLVSFLMLELGVTSMAIRYPVAVGAAYLFFLGLLAFWLALHRRRRRSSRDGSGFDLPSFDLPSGGGGGGPVEIPVGGGGQFGGAGASSGFADAQALVASPSAPSSGSSGGDWLGFDLGLDEGCAVVIPLLVVLAGVVGSAYVVWTAPTLLAELMVDGVLVAALYRRLGRGDGPGWVLGAVRRTWLPAVAIAVTMSALALWMQYLHPEAHSLGAFWRAASAS